MVNTTIKESSSDNPVLVVGIICSPFEPVTLAVSPAPKPNSLRFFAQQFIRKNLIHFTSEQVGELPDKVVDELLGLHGGK